MKKIRFASIILIFVFLISLTSCGQSNGADYSDLNNWAYYESGASQKTADVFFICPTVYSGSADSRNMPLTDESARASFLGATNMEKGLYDGDGRFFAPYYRQAAMYTYTLSKEESEKYLSSAFEDVKAAFNYYYENENNGRPIILAGFSQGADMCIRLIKECFEDKTDQLVACYAIGWRVTQEEIEQYPWLKFAQGEKDTGVVIAYNSEDKSIDDSLMIPKGTKTLAINPLNWKTDGTPADKSLNLGACFTDYNGSVTKEIPHLTGAYIDSERGALKVTDINPADYPAEIDIFKNGIYHVYDYQFFYRNIQKNVSVRLESFENQNN